MGDRKQYYIYVMKDGDNMRKMGISVQQAKKIRADKGLDETKLQKIRVKRGLSQSGLAKKSGVSVRAIQMYEQQERLIDNAKLITICNLCVALNCKLVDILEDKETIAKLQATK